MINSLKKNFEIGRNKGLKILGAIIPGTVRNTQILIGLGILALTVEKIWGNSKHSLKMIGAYSECFTQVHFT